MALSVDLCYARHTTRMLFLWQDVKKHIVAESLLNEARASRHCKIDNDSDTPVGNTVTH